MSLFKFDEAATRIFEYSKGERDQDGNFIAVYGDPAVIDRQLDICLPNRNALVDQHVNGIAVQRSKAQAIKAYEANPDAYMAELATKSQYDRNGQSIAPYQPLLPNPQGFGEPVPNPESALDFVKRNNIPAPTDGYTPEEAAVIKMGGVAHQNLCRGIRDAFGLLDLDEKTGKGCTDLMAIDVLNHFQDWIEKKSGNTPASPTSSPPSPAT